MNTDDVGCSSVQLMSERLLRRLKKIIDRLNVVQLPVKTICLLLMMFDFAGFCCCLVSIISLKSMSDCTDLFYCRLNVFALYAEVVSCDRPCHCECIERDNLFHGAVSISQ